MQRFMFGVWLEARYQKYINLPEINNKLSREHFYKRVTWWLRMKDETRRPYFNPAPLFRK